MHIIPSRATHRAAPLHRLKDKSHLLVDTGSKLSANSAHFVFGSRLDWLGGLQKLIPQLTRSVRQECTLNDGGKWASTFDYIVNQPAAERLAGKLGEDGKPLIFDLGHAGMR